MINRPQFFLLDGKTPVACSDVLEWAAAFDISNRRVALDDIDGIEISTVFLGLDHNYQLQGPPILFETMVFDDSEHGGSMRRYATWDEAETGHRWVVNETRLFLAQATERADSLLSHLIGLSGRINL